MHTHTQLCVKTTGAHEKLVRQYVSLGGGRKDETKDMPKCTDLQHCKSHANLIFI